MLVHRSHHNQNPNPHRSYELTHRSPPNLHLPSPPPAEVRCLIIRYASLNDHSDHVRRGVPHIRHFRKSNRRGLLTDVPTGGVVGRNNLSIAFMEKLEKMMDNEFRDWKFIGAERSMKGPPSNNTPYGYSEKRANVYIERWR